MASELADVRGRLEAELATTRAELAEARERSGSELAAALARVNEERRTALEAVELKVRRQKLEGVTGLVHHAIEQDPTHRGHVIKPPHFSPCGW